MHVTVFSVHSFEQPFLLAAARARHEQHFVDEALGLTTADRAEGSPAVAIFVGDAALVPVLERLAARGVRCLLVRAAGHDQVRAARGPAPGFARGQRAPITPPTPSPSTPWP